MRATPPGDEQTKKRGGPPDAEASCKAIKMSREAMDESGAHGAVGTNALGSRGPSD